ncbi:ribosome biogenesis (Nop4) [Aspergillus nomiae NRRL 13137]|uniref:Ribosome biogenesis (Nop4) n=1 Tax=Aspergillus nomiae NRRL (strain ATCC 15546 / NRRL 13137 / CBS 260.88 / M93) TaxID=1509407 RepID=A0A0L1IQ67_ASPN3|nr:ribosome biogenesis (Nop4) [Aspergillus nomiae NRRL 13137]KNG81731.1 ribosome biogenesis (Nop4) [Aspergillus nomiae NRRL 13137]
MAGRDETSHKTLPEGRGNSEEVEAAMDTAKNDTVKEESASNKLEELSEHFSQSYVIKHALVVNDSETKKSKGYGFVTFADVDDAKAALEEFNGSVFDEKKIKVDYAQPRHRTIDENAGKSVPSSAALEAKKQREQERATTQPPKLIVRNLPWSIKEPDDLAVHFRSYGKIKHVNLPKKGNKLAGFGFVVLRGKKNAEKALEAVNGKEVDGRTLAVDWAVDKAVWENTQQDSQEKGNAEEEESSDAEMADDAEAESNVEDDEDLPDDEDMDDIDQSDEDEDEEEEEEEEEEEKEDERTAATVFIRNLPFTCTDETLYEHFTQFGPLRYARIVVDPETERPRGTGFVCFWKAEDAAACVRDAPKQQDTIAPEKEKAKKGSIAIKHSVLQNENADPTGRYTLDGRVLQVSRAVSKSRATQLAEEGVSRRLVRDTDKRRLYLLSEGTIPSDSPLYKKLSPSEIKMREDSFKQRQNFIKKNPTLHLSLTRLSVRNVPRHVTSKDLKQLARQAVVGFAQDVSAGLRQPLSKDELQRASEEMKEAEQLRKKKGLGVVRQAKIVFEGRDGSKVEEKNSGAGRSEVMVLSTPATGSEDAKDKKKRLIVEFALENANVVKRRQEQQERMRNSKKGSQKNGDSSKIGDSQNQTPPKGNKRKRSESNSDQGQDGADAEEQNKIAKRNRIIAKKRMQRRTRKGKA